MHAPSQLTSGNLLDPYLINKEKKENFLTTSTVFKLPSTLFLLIYYQQAIYQEELIYDKGRSLYFERHGYFLLQIHKKIFIIKVI